MGDPVGLFGLYLFGDTDYRFFIDCLYDALTPLILSIDYFKTPVAT